LTRCAALRDEGLSPTDMVSTRYSVTESFVNRRSLPSAYDRDSSIGWNAWSNATIRTKDLTVLDSLLAALVELRGVSIQDLSFYVDDLEKFYDTLRQEASVSAHLRATQLAAPLGCEPAHPITIHDGTRIVANNSSDGGFVIRGSRSTDSQVLVDGLTTISRAVSIQFELVPK
jgi:uncharacterized protein YggE